jgi:hypothetical protein
MPLQFITPHHNKGPSQQKTIQAEIYIYKAPMPNGLHCHIEALA